MKIKATSEAFVPAGSHIAKSLLVPGWGDYKICNGNYHFIYGVAAYGSLGASIVYYSLANTNRKNYLNSMEIEKRNNFYNTYTNQKTLSYVFAATAAAIWVYDIVKVAVKTSRLKKSITPERSNYYYDISKKVIAGTSRVQYLNTKIAYDLAMDDAKEMFDNKDYVASRNAYLHASELSPNETLPKEKIAEIDKILAEIKALNDKYNAAEAKGDSLFNAGQYEAAKNAFNTALKYKPDETYPKKKIVDADNALKKIALDQEYNNYIAKGDNSFNAKDYENAKIFYNNAKKLRPNAAYPESKIQEINQKQEQIAQQKKEEEFNAMVRQGDAAFNKGDYVAASNYYDKAKTINPSDLKIASKLDIALKKIDQIARAEEEKWEKEEQKKNDKNYKQAIIDGDAAYNNKEYDKAKTCYQTASTIKPTESYPKNKIIAINKLIAAAEVKIAENTSFDLPSLFEKCKPAVFFVVTSDYVDQYQGSGFFITSSGVGISNYHVFKGTYESEATIYTEDGNSYKIEKVYEKDEDLDYIIFKVSKPNGKTFPKLKIASKTPKVGENVFAIGNPEGLEKTLSTGIVSGIRGDNDEYIQTNTAITHGSSGGPLFNSKGEVIGITSMGVQEGSLFFALNIQKIPYWKYLSY
ncbi:MAG TPA: trypsin-like peptidase domain-containing protein [Bacteroidales bacterium]|nr:trypsin-like peptidase domain-containing protein [Bacteroidales bacterium]